MKTPMQKCPKCKSTNLSTGGLFSYYNHKLNIEQTDISYSCNNCDHIWKKTENFEKIEYTQKCPYCKKKGIYYLGREVTNGNPNSPAADTEVNLHYKCKNCKNFWLNTK